MDKKMAELINEIYFITKVINNRVNIFEEVDYTAKILINNLTHYRKKFKFALYGYVIMPDHYHIILDTLQRESITKIKEDMNKYIARQIVDYLKMTKNPILTNFVRDIPIRRGHNPYIYRIFQKGKYDFEILTRRKLVEKLNYVHNNPIKAGLVKEYTAYRYSSASNYLLGDNSIIEMDTLPL